MLYLVLIIFLTMNITGLSLMNIDKKRAIQHAWRIKEKTLWLTAICGGAIGAAAGMHLFHHKTKHLSFKIGFPILAVIEAFLYISFIKWSYHFSFSISCNNIKN